MPGSGTILKTILVVLFLLIIFFYMILIIIVILNIFRSKWRFNRYLKMENRNAVIEIYKYYLSLLSLLGFSLNPGETALMFAGRIDSIKKFHSMTFKEITNIFILSRYSNRDIDKSEKIKMIKFKQELLESFKKDMKLYRFFIVNIISK